MKRRMKKILMIIGLLVLILIGTAGWFFIKMKSEIKTMSPAKSGIITDNIYCIKDDFVNIYLIKDGDSYLLIDAGNNLDSIKKGLSQLNIKPEEISNILLTHTDRDHVAGLELFVNANIYLTKNEVKMINGEQSKFLFIGNSIGDKSYTTLVDKQEIKLGNLDIKVIEMPGHTTGSACYIINKKHLFTGDALSIKNGKLDMFNDFFNMDSKQSIKSISNITNLDGVEYIFTGHHGISNNYSSTVENWEETKENLLKEY